MINTKENLLLAIKEGKTFKYTYFYATSHPFSQFHEAAFEAKFRGEVLKFTCAEQFMMFMKAVTFKDEQTMKKIIDSPYDPKFYKEMGRKVKDYDDAKWSGVRSQYVVMGNKLKFGQNKDLKARLLSTGENVLVEASPYDAIWGVGLDKNSPLIKNPRTWKGTNLLGFALMEVRESFK